MGLAATLEALSTSTAGTAVARFFAGTSRGTFSSTIPLYYTYWYTRDESALRITMYVGITASLGAFSTWVAYLVTLIKSHLPPNKVSHRSSSLTNYRFFYCSSVSPFYKRRRLIIGIPTIVMGKLIFWVLPGRPETSRYVTKRQRAVAIARAKRGLHPEPPSTIDTSAIKPAFHDIRIYCYALLYTTILMPNLSLFYFLPSVIEQCGWGEMPKSALMTVPPLASSFIGMILVAWKSDRMRDRGRWVALLAFVGAVGYVLLLTVPIPGLRYCAVFLVSWGSLYSQFVSY
jgi:MFS transporter, ACS family, DAL5 transporter family protein